MATEISQDHYTMFFTYRDDHMGVVWHMGGNTWVGGYRRRWEAGGPPLRNDKLVPHNLIKKTSVV